MITFEDYQLALIMISFVATTLMFIFALRWGDKWRTMYDKAIDKLVDTEMKLDEEKEKVENINQVNQTLIHQIHTLQEDFCYVTAMASSPILSERLSNLNLNGSRLNSMNITAAKCYTITPEYRNLMDGNAKIKVANASPPEPEPAEHLKEIFEDRHNIRREMCWPVPLKWRNNTYEELNNALDSARLRFARWDEEERDQQGDGNPSTWTVREREDGLYDVENNHIKVLTGLTSTRECIRWINNAKTVWREQQRERYG